MTRLATVIGASGFIGGHVMRRLQRDGWDCRSSSRADPYVLKRPLGHVFYCAGLTADYAQRPHDTVQAHVGALNALLAGAQFDSLVYLSSTRLYDSQPGLAVDEDSALLLNPAQPRHVYDLSKAMGEALCRHACQGRARIARLGCVYAHDPADPSFLADLLRRVAPLGPPEAAGQAPAPTIDIDTSARASRDYVHIDDVVQALLLIATRGTQAAYNVASGQNISNAQLFERLGQLRHCRLRALRCERLPCAAPVSIARMRSELAWQPTPVLDKLAELLPSAVPGHQAVHDKPVPEKPLLHVPTPTQAQAATCSS